MIAALLLRFWREITIGALALGLIASCVSRDHRIASSAVAREKSRRADSTLAVVTPARIKAETTMVHDIATVTRFVTRTDTVERWRADTVYAPGDSTPRIAVPAKELARSDSGKTVCLDLTLSCAAFRSWANKEIASLRDKVQAAPVAEAKSCTWSNALWAGIGASAGYTARSLRR